ncbi:MAG: methyltransferase domain-containing protein [Nibricoccus sp.]
MLFSANTSGRSVVPGSLWGPHAHDWFQIQETQSRALYDIVLKALKLSSELPVLDAGCGSGMFCELAAAKGAHVTGIDSSPELLQLARQRTTPATFIDADVENLPFSDGAFDVVTLLNTLQHVRDAGRTLGEARRVLRPGGRIAVAVWARQENCDMAEYYRLLTKLLPITPPKTPPAFAYSATGVLHRTVAQAGFHKLIETEALTIWSYAHEEAALRGLLSTGAAAQAINCAGIERVRERVREFLTPFRLPRGGYRLENAFRYLVAQRS